MNFDNFRERMRELPYPPNNQFNPETFDPVGEMVGRVKALKKYAPELMDGGETLLDIGCNKGFLSFYLRNKYKHIIGYDIIKEDIEFAEKLRIVHKLGHIQFFHQRFEDIPEDMKFDVVYLGQCNHYLFRDAVRRGEHSLIFLDKVKRLSDRIIAIDGPFSLEDPSPKFDSKTDHWSDTTKKWCSIEGYSLRLKPEFQLESYNWSGGTKGRKIAVFKRIML